MLKGAVQPVPPGHPASSATRGRFRNSVGRYTLALVLALLFGLQLYKRKCHHDQPSSRRHQAILVEARHGVVASENHRCSEIGVRVLKDGGNAVDSAIATTLCIGVVNMFSSGIGGGGFMTVRVPPKDSSSSSEVFTIDFRETGPALANSTMYVGRPLDARFGGLSVGIPGELRGLEEAHKRWGSLPWKRLVQPSVELSAGWRVDVELGQRIPWFTDLMLNNPDWGSIFAPAGRFLREGEVIKRTNLSKTLAVVAEEGAGAFYKGPIADSIIRKIRASGGIMSHSDLENYEVIVDRALEGTYNGKKVYTSNAPGSGPVLLHMLNLFEALGMSERSALNTHRLVEILKFGFAARTRIGDPDFNSDVTANTEEIMSKKFASVIAHNVTDDTTHPPEYYHPEFDIVNDHGTSHSSVVDKNGMAVAITSTVNMIFGSQVLDPETGVILNDEMDDFSIPGTPNGFGLWPSRYNYPAAGKRPLSSTSPTIIENADGTFYLALGGSGGSRIFGAVFQTIVNMEWGMNPSEAIEYGRLHDQLYPLILDADDTYAPDLLQALIDRGHNVTVADKYRVAAVVQAVMHRNGRFFGASDSRKNGIAAGY